MLVVKNICTVMLCVVCDVILAVVLFCCFLLFLLA